MDGSARIRPGRDGGGFDIRTDEDLSENALRRTAPGVSSARRQRCASLLIAMMLIVAVASPSATAEDVSASGQLRIPKIANTKVYLDGLDAVMASIQEESSGGIVLAGREAEILRGAARKIRELSSRGVDDEILDASLSVAGAFDNLATIDEKYYNLPAFLILGASNSDQQHYMTQQIYSEKQGAVQLIKDAISRLNDARARMASKYGEAWSQS